MGLVFYYVLSKGKHPFGDPLRRQGNILNEEYSLSDLNEKGFLHIILFSSYYLLYLILHILNPLLKNHMFKRFRIFSFQTFNIFLEINVRFYAKILNLLNYETEFI